MATDKSVPFMTEVLPASDFATEPVTCPKCGSNDLVLYGHLSYPGKLVLEAGVISSQDIDFQVKDNFAMSRIDCLKCHVRFEVQPDREHMLYVENSSLRDMFKKATGKDPYGEQQC